MIYNDILFARPSFFGGMARLLDFGNTLNVYNGHKSPGKADYFAIKSDFCAVGQDIQSAVSGFGEKMNVEK